MSVSPEGSPEPSKASGRFITSEVSPEERRATRRAALSLGGGARCMAGGVWSPESADGTPPRNRALSGESGEGSAEKGGVQGGSGTIAHLALCAAPLFAGPISTSPEKGSKRPKAPDDAEGQSTPTAGSPPGSVPLEASPPGGGSGGRAPPAPSGSASRGRPGRAAGGASMRDRRAASADRPRGTDRSFMTDSLWAREEEQGSLSRTLEAVRQDLERVGESIWADRSADQAGGGGAGVCMGATLPPSVAAKTGVLYKKREVLPGWRPRTFMLDATQRLLRYYLPNSARPRGSIPLEGCSVVAAPTGGDGKRGKACCGRGSPFFIPGVLGRRASHLSSCSRFLGGRRGGVLLSTPQ